MEKRRTLYTQPTIEASTKSCLEKSLEASGYVRAKDRFIEPLQLTRVGWRKTIETWIQRPPPCARSETWSELPHVYVSSYTCIDLASTMLESMPLDYADE